MQRQQPLPDVLAHERVAGLAGHFSAHVWFRESRDGGCILHRGASFVDSNAARNCWRSVPYRASRQLIEAMLPSFELAQPHSQHALPRANVGGEHVLLHVAVQLQHGFRFSLAHVRLTACDARSHEQLLRLLLEQRRGKLLPGHRRTNRELRQLIDHWSHDVERWIRHLVQLGHLDDRHHWNVRAGHERRRMQLLHGGLPCVVLREQRHDVGAVRRHDAHVHKRCHVERERVH